MSKPTLWVLSGGNGAGKSTFYRLILEPLGVPFVNADLVARVIDPDDPEEASYAAARLAENFRQSMLEARVSFCFETVFSHPSKIDFIASARSLGYCINLVYVGLGDSSLNEARVAQRVSEGGHSVPADKIRKRIPRTLNHVSAAVPLVDGFIVVDNSSKSDPLRELYRVTNGALTVANPSKTMPDWALALLPPEIRP